MFSRSGTRNKARKACTYFQVPASQASPYGVSDEHGGRLWRKPVYPISRFTIYVTYSARVSVGSPQTPSCSGRCGTAVRRQSGTISSEWLTRCGRASNGPTKKPIKTSKLLRFYYGRVRSEKEAAQRSVSG